MVKNHKLIFLPVQRNNIKKELMYFLIYSIINYNHLSYLDDNILIKYIILIF